MIRVLVVEDEPIAARATAAYVERVAGFAVAGVAHTAAEAVRRLRDDEVDLCLLDMHLPDGHGLDLARRIRAAGLRTDVIAVTSARDLAVVRAAVSAGVVQYLLKPFGFPALRDRLERYAAYVEGTDGQAVDQQDVDRMLGALRSPHAVPAPKGVHPDTLRRVLDALTGAHGPLSAGETAEVAGVSRITARRYLEHLTEVGQVVRSPRYGGAGRPEHEYRPT